MGICKSIYKCIKIEPILVDPNFPARYNDKDDPYPYVDVPAHETGYNDYGSNVSNEGPSNSIM